VLRAARRRSLLGVAGGLLLLAGCEPNNQGYAPSQPIEYSHAAHAGANQIPCQYCHYQAERGRYAGIPPLAVCMNCHEKALIQSPEIDKLKAAVAEQRPVAWVRVHRLPDHVYFNHRVHVSSGVACQTCHGPVEGMGRVEQWAPLTMGWCLECHRRGTPAGGPALLAVAAGNGNRLTDCGVCHH